MRAIVAVAAAACASACGRIGFGPDDGIAGDLLVVERVTWSDAEAACFALGKQLVTIADAAQNASAFARAATIPIDPDYFPTTNHWSIMWMGGRSTTDAADPASWTWVSGEPMTYTNWRPGEPNAGEGCLVMLGAENGLWDNRVCGALYGYLCEADE